MLELSRIAKFRSKELRFCTTVNWPQKNSAEVMKDQQSINSILPTLLDRRLLQDCERELLPSCIKTYQDFPPSLPEIPVQSASRKSHRARRSTNFNHSSTLGLEIVKRKKRKTTGKAIYMTGTSCRPDLILLRGWKPSTSRPDDQERKRKKHVKRKGNLKKQKEQGAGKESEGRRKNKSKKKGINGIQNRI